MLDHPSVGPKKRRRKWKRIHFSESLEPRLLLATDLPEFGQHLTLEQSTPRNVRWDPAHGVSSPVEFGAESDFASSLAPREVVFVDRGVEGYQELVDSIGLREAGARPLDLVLLETDRDGVEQITEHLQGHSNIAAIHILSHGSAGSLQLGNSRMERESLQQRSRELAAWGDSLLADGDILLYGCNVAKGQWGVGFVEELSRLTGADVGGSTDLTGAAQLGGDWQLEYTTGRIEASTVIDVGAAKAFSQTLAAIQGRQNANDFFRIDNTGVSVKAALDDAVKNEGNDVSASENTPFVFQQHGNEPIDLSGQSGNNAFIFLSKPQLNELATSTLDGGTGNNTLDVSRVNESFIFEINQIDAGPNDDTKSSVKTSNVVVAPLFFPGIRNVQTFKGGKKANTYKFLPSFSGAGNNAAVVIDNAASDKENKLDFSQNDATLRIATDPTGKLTISDSGNNHQPLVNTQTKISEVTTRNNGGTVLDLQAFAVDEQPIVTIGPNSQVKLEYQPANQKVVLVSVSHVDTIVLGKGTNALAFRENGSITILQLPGDQSGDSDDNGKSTRVELDYSKFGAPATVNKGASINLGAGNGSTLTPVAPIDTANWNAYQYQLTAEQNEGHARFTFGGATSAGLDLSQPDNVADALTGILNNMDGIRDAVVARDGGNSAWDISFNSTRLDNGVARLGSPDSVATYSLTSTVTNDDTLTLASNAQGNRSIALHFNDTNNVAAQAAVNLQAARRDRMEIAQALTGVDQNLNVAVSGYGTDKMPWKIQLNNSSFLAANVVDTTELSSSTSAKVRIAETMPVNVGQQPSWNLSNGAMGGSFKLQFTDGTNGQFDTDEIPFDAPASLIEKRLKDKGGGDFVFDVVRDDDNPNAWTITIADQRSSTADLQASRLTIVNATDAPANSASGIGDTSLANLTLTRITGSGRDGDQLFVDDNGASVNIIAGNRNTQAAGSGVDDTIDLGDGQNLASGGGGDDTLNASAKSGKNTLIGGAGDNTLRGGNHADELYGGDDNDGELSGGRGDDVLDGGEGDDQLHGQQDEDMLFGGVGMDHLLGGSHDDQLTGGTQNDILEGNQQDDTYFFQDGWNADNVIERDGEGTDTLDFSQVTTDLTVTIAANASVDAGKAAAVTVTSSGNDGVTGENNGSIQFVEKIKGGSAGSEYKVSDGWIGKLLIDDSANGLYLGTLDLSDVNENLDVKVIGGNNNRPTIEVRKSNGNGNDNLISATHVANLIVGKMQTTVRFESNVAAPTSGFLHGSIIAPANTPAHRVVLDYTGAGGDVTINLGEEVNLDAGAQSTLTGPGTPIPGAGTQQQGAAPTEARWQLVALDKTKPFSLTFGDRATGQHTTDRIFLYERGLGNGVDLLASGLRGLKSAADQITEIQNALQALPNVAVGSVEVDGEGTLTDPWVIRITGNGLTSPVLSSDKFSVSTLTKPDPNGNVQQLSLFADQGTDRSFTLWVNDGVNRQATTPLALTTTRNTVNNLITALDNALGVAGNAQLQQGIGTHHDPWSIQMPAGTRITKVDVTDIVSLDVKLGRSQSRGFLQLQNVEDDDAGVNYPTFNTVAAVPPAPGTPGQAEEWRLYNSATTGAFTLSYEMGTTNALPFNATTDEIERELRELKDNNGAVVVGHVEVTGGGSVADPWVIKIAPVDFDFMTVPTPALTVQNAGVTVPGNVVHGVGGGLDLSANQLIVSQITGVTNHKNNVIIPPDNGLVASPIILVGNSDVDTISGGRAVNSAVAPNNAIAGASGNDYLFGGEEDGMTIDAGPGDDHLFGGSGSETLRGVGGENRIFGGSGNDSLEAGAGHQGEGDELFGGSGNDDLQGGQAKDELHGGPGNDLLSGGLDDDEFIFTNGFGFDIAQEEAQFRNDDTLDFSNVTRPVTHVLSEGQLISGTLRTGLDLDAALVKDQDKLSLFDPGGVVHVRDAFGFSTGQLEVGTTTSASLTSQLQVPLVGGAYVVTDQKTLRLGIDFGDGTEHILEGTIAAVGGNLSVNQLAGQLQTALRNSTPAGLNAALNVTTTGNKLIITVTNGPVNTKKLIRVLPSTTAFDNAVIVGNFQSKPNLK